MDGEAMQIQRCRGTMMSPEIVEIEESKSFGGGLSGVGNDIYVTVGKDDLHVLKWAIDHALSPGSRVYLVHVFPPLTYIATPVGRLSKRQLSKEQVRIYVNEENNRRRNLLQKYIRLCNDSKVVVDTMLLESNSTAKAIVELIPVLNITHLVIGTKRPLSSGMLRKKMGKGDYVKKNAPEYCEVSLVCNGKEVSQANSHLIPSPPSLSSSSSSSMSSSQNHFFNCARFLSRRLSR